MIGLKIKHIENSKSYEPNNEIRVTRIEVESKKYEMSRPTEEQKKEIFRLAEKGVPDVEIVKQLRVHRYYVCKLTAEYWKIKMENK